MNVKENLTLTTLVDYLNQSYIKKSNKKFTTSDAQGYIKRGHLPNYLGENCITEVSKIKGVKLYNIKSIE